MHSRHEQGLELMLRSLHVNVLAAHPRPVLLFYANDVPPEEYTLDVLCRLSPPPIRHLLEVRLGLSCGCNPAHGRRSRQSGMSRLRQSCAGLTLSCRPATWLTLTRPRAQPLALHESASVEAGRAVVPVNVDGSAGHSAHSARRFCHPIKTSGVTAG